MVATAVPSTSTPQPRVGDLATVIPPIPTPESEGIYGRVTHYGESYNGQPLGCGTGTYDSGDPSIIAVGPAQYRDWPCGTVLVLRGPAGELRGVRQDACPGCGVNHLDLSEAGIAQVCGKGAGTCAVTIEEG